MYQCKFPHLFSPITLAGTVFRNRLFASPTGTSYLSADHHPLQEAVAYYERKAMGGVASVCVGDAIVSPASRYSHNSISLYDPRSFPSLTRLAEAVMRHGAIASMELCHAGSRAREAAATGEQRYGPVESVTETGELVLPMSEDQIWEAIEQHARVAGYMKRCGFGMVTIHGGHGFLFTEFMSPITNRRTDKWGGSPENRSRLAIETLKAVRKAVGPKFPIEMRISGSECHPGGYDVNVGIEFAKQVDGYVDLLHISAGSHEVPEVFTVTHPDMFLPDGVNVKYAAEIKKHVKQTRIATIGALADPAMMEEIIASGQADVVEAARAFFADPDLPNKARYGRENEINKCMRCLSCFSSLINKNLYVCAINPEIGHEIEIKAYVTPAEKKKVLVAGGGIAGMRAALTAASYGHEVTLCEKTNRLGGVLRCEDGVSFKKHLTEFLDNQERALMKSTVDVRLNTAVTQELANDITPDVIIAALGSRPVVPDITGIEHAVCAEDVYYDSEKAGQRVVIIGGGLVGSELAVHLGRLGREVAIIEIMDALNDNGNRLHGRALGLELARCKVSVHLSTKVLSISQDGVLAENPDGKQTVFDADTVVYAVGQRPLDEEAEALRFLAPEFHRIGDCLVPNNIVEATRTGHFISRNIGRFI